MLVKILESFIPGIHGMPNKCQQDKCWVRRFLENSLPIRVVT